MRGNECVGFNKMSLLSCSAGNECRIILWFLFVPKRPSDDWINTSSQHGCYHKSHKAGETVNKHCHSHSRVTDGLFRPASGWGRTDGGREGKERRGWGSLIMVCTGSSLSHPISSEKMLHHIIWLWKHTDSFMTFIYHQEQAENPPRCDPHLLSDRVSQRGTDGQSRKKLFLLCGYWYAVTVPNHSLTCFSVFFFFFW